MKTLYMSDLEGILLQSNEKTSEYTSRTINALIEKVYTIPSLWERSWPWEA